MRSNKLLRGFILLGLLFVCMQNMQAQALNTATIRETVEFWKVLENPIQIGAGNDPWINFNMPFTFSYDNQNITSIFIYGNGWIKFNAAGDPSGLNMPYFAGSTNSVYWYGRDLFTEGSLSYKVEGSAPFRVLTVQHLGARYITDQTGASFDAQIKFYETTNEIQIIYGNAAGLGGGGVNGWLGFVGSVTSRYINIQPRQPEIASIFYYNPGNPNNQTWLTKNVVQYFPVGRCFTLSTSSRIADIYPNSNTILTTGTVYTGEQHPHVRISRATGQPEIKIRYTINGPVGNSKLIYTALDSGIITSTDKVYPNPQPLGNLIRVDMPHAKDLAGVLSNGALDLTNITNTPSGIYNVQAVLENATTGVVLHTVNSQFTIAFPNDVAITSLEAPVDSTGSIYSYISQIPVQVVVRNQGSNPIEKLKLTYKIYDLTSGTLMTTVDSIYDLTSNPMVLNESRIFAMKRYIPTKVGSYRITVEAKNTEVFADDIPDNNIYPRTGAKNHVFLIGYETEVGNITMLSPTSPVYLNRPFRPSARIQNNGVADVSSVPATFTIKKAGVEVYKETIIIDDIPSGFVKYVNVYWPKSFIPTELGSYEVIIEVNAPSDEDASNNRLNTSFSVSAGLKGTYTISKSGGNYPTINDAVKALYKNGVDGPVTFLLNDAVYNEGNATFNEPAIDFSSKIIGANSNNTITFAVNPLNANYGAVVINLNTANGIGMFFGQNTLPKYPEATVLGVSQSLVKNYANSDGYIIFDGGNKKSIVLNLKTTSTFRAVAYLGNGASNVTIKNCIIKDGLNQAPSYACRLPLSVYNSLSQSFSYEANSTVSGTFSTGVLLRTTSPKDALLGTNVIGLDTLVNKNNVIMNNEISNFGYGIVSIGLGAMYDNGAGAYKMFYNTNNKYSTNRIFDVSKAGVFVGFEKSSEIFRNRIYNITSTCDGNGVGVAVGGEMRTGWFGYHNIDLFVSSNEISNISALNNVYGIKVDQNYIEFVDKDEKFFFPNEDERIKVVNNNIWGLVPNALTTNVFGILMTTERSTMNWSTMTLTPTKADYFTKNDFIANNTINFEDDGINNKGAIAAVALLNNMHTTLYNNAIAVNDKIIDAASPFMASLFMYSMHPSDHSLMADRNAYWFGNSNATIVRFVRIDNKSTIIESGSKNEFFTIDQWQQWTKQDILSVVGDWTLDYTKVGNLPYTYRVKSNPAPINSILNNRGKNLPENPVDIDGKSRGLVGERYDIGAVEFSGTNLARDLEVIAISEPGKYKATAGLPFDDAEYIMTTSPVNVVSHVRSNGSMLTTHTKATLKIYRQNPTGGWDSEMTVDAPIDELFYSDDVKLNFKLADGINNPPSNPEFFPKTYGDLKNLNYQIPPQFTYMRANVTPLYKLEVTVPFDEYNANNKWEKVVRFYIRKSPIQLMVSAEDIMPITTASPIENIAANLNLDSLVKGFEYLGWRVDLNLEQPKIDIDIFDRNKWEPRSIDYSMYRSLFWVDGHDTKAGVPSVLRRIDRESIVNFLNAGDVENKKNFVIASQEMVRNEGTANAAWVKLVLNAKAATPNNPAGVDGNYNGLNVKGVKLAVNQLFTIKSTAFANDDYPKAGLFDRENGGFGATTIGFKYDYHYQDGQFVKIKDEKRIATLTTATIPYNVVYLGIDWRHWGDIQKTLRAIIDYIEDEGSVVIPVELLSFDATPAGKRVDLSWSTASEINSSYFEVQRAEVTTAGVSEFTSIANEKATGNASSFAYYGPIVDNNVDYGNVYAYKLKMVDIDGTVGYSDTKFVTINGNNAGIELNEVSPNPVVNSASFEYSLSNASPIRISIFDMTGKEVAVLFDGTQTAGSFTMNINSADLTSGNYHIILNANDVLLMKKFSVVK